MSEERPEGFVRVAALSGPLAHATVGLTLIDRELFRFDQIGAAAGHPHGVFSLTPQDLVPLTDAPVVDVVVAQ